MPITVDYEVLTEDFEEGSDQNGVYAFANYMVDWDERYQFVNDMLGSSAIVAGTWIQTLPHQYIPSPNMFAMQAKIQGEGSYCRSEDNVDAPAWSKAKVSIWYRTPSFNFSGSQDPQCLNSFGQTVAECNALLWAESQLESAMETYSVPGTYVRFESDGMRLASPCRLMIPTRTLTIAWHKYPAIPQELDMNFESMLNDSEFLGRPTGTVQYLGMSNARQMSADTTLSQQLKMTFRWRPYDWNMEPKIKQVDVSAEPGPSFQGWDYVHSDGVRRYPYGNLFNLISFNPIP